MDGDARVPVRESETDMRKSVGTLLETQLSLEDGGHFQTSLTGDSSSSDFGDSACGEPFTAQHLVIDFTLDEEVDTEYVQKKCCDFWEFINSHTELKHLCVMPETDDNIMDMPDASTESASSVPHDAVAPETLDKTAVSMLSLVDHKGLIDRAFEPKICQSYCTLGSREYVENDPTKPVPLEKCVCTCAEPCIKPCKPGMAALAPPAAQQRSDVQALCNTMREWDIRHPKCRPICKSRRREWKGQIQNTSAELLLDRKPIAQCFRRWPTKVYPNSPCPLFARSKKVIIRERNAEHPPPVVVRVCQAPLDDDVVTPYLKYKELAMLNGAWKAARACCPFCTCCACCPCGARDYAPLDAEREHARRADMRHFDQRVKSDYQIMRIMYDNH